MSITKATKTWFSYSMLAQTIADQQDKCRVASYKANDSDALLKKNSMSKDEGLFLLLPPPSSP